MRLAPEKWSAWHRLLESAAKIRDLAPWKWMGDRDVFGLQDPDAPRIGFVTNRNLSEGAFAVEILLGPRAFYDYRRMRQSGTAPAREMEENLLLVPRLEVAFRCERPPEDWEVRLSRALNLRDFFSGPRFRSFQPGYFPWMPSYPEVRLMTRALEQYRHVALRKQVKPELLNCNGDHRFLIRERRHRGNRVEWQERTRHIPPPEPASIPIVWNQSDIDGLNRMPKQRHIVEADFFLFSGEFAEPEQPPLCTYMLMMVHAQSKLVLCAEPMTVVTSLERLWGAVPGVLASALVNFNIRPHKIRVRSTPLLRLLKTLQEAVDFDLESCSRLSSIDATRETMEAFFQQHASR
jgi:hypothetical protein